jgi:hypothetical protein
MVKRLHCGTIWKWKSPSVHSYLQSHAPALVPARGAVPKAGLAAGSTKLTHQLSVASVERVSLHWPRRHNFCALLRNRPALVDAPIHRMDGDDHGLFKRRFVVPGDCANIRWRPSMFSLSRCQQGKNERKEIRPTESHAETRSDLHKTCDYTRLAVHLFRLRE